MSYNSKYTGQEVEEAVGKANTALQSHQDISHLATKEALNGLQAQFNALVGGNASKAIESFNEVIAFLSNLEDTESLSGIISSIERQIAEKISKVNPVMSVDGNDIKISIDGLESNRITVPYATSSGHSATSDTATNLAYPPTLSIVGNNIRVSAGGKSSEKITVPYATSVAEASKAVQLKTSRKIFGQYFDGTANVTAGPILGNGNAYAIADNGGTSRNLMYFDTSNRAYFGRGVPGAGGDSYLCGTKVYLCQGTSLAVMCTVSSSGLDVKGAVTQTSDINMKDVIEDVELSVNDIAEAPLFRYTYKDDESKSIHVGTSAQYWADKENGNSFCKMDENGYYTMDIAGCALASVISLARELMELKKKIYQ